MRRFLIFGDLTNCATGVTGNFLDRGDFGWSIAISAGVIGAISSSNVKTCSGRIAGKVEVATTDISDLAQQAIAKYTMPIK